MQRAAARERRRRAPLRLARRSPAGCAEIGHDGDGFAFDNERPRHRVWLEPFRLATRLGHLRRVSRLHRRRRLSPAGVLAVGRLGDGAAARAGQAPLYWRDATATTGASSRCPARRAVDPAEPVVPCQLLRGRRLRALGRQAPADRGGVGGGRGRGGAAARRQSDGSRRLSSRSRRRRRRACGR